MRILFYLPNFHIRGPYAEGPAGSDTALHEGMGLSGTDTAVMEVSRCLAARGHTVFISHWTSVAVVQDGVHLVPGVDDSVLRDLDWYCPNFFLEHPQHQEIMGMLPKSTRVLVWLHCPMRFEVIGTVLHAGFRLALQCPSPWVEEFMCGWEKYTVPRGLWTVGSGVAPYFRSDEPAEARRGRWAFCATFERGGAVAARVFQAVRAALPEAASDFVAASYYKGDEGVGGGCVRNVGSLGKRDVAELLATSEYFVYPLALPESDMIHHDTFAAVVLEALASGVIVVTWDVACYAGVYGDHVVRVQVPEWVVASGYDPRAPYGAHPFFKSDEAVAALAGAVLSLEGDRSRKARLREEGARWARGVTWDARAEEMERRLVAAMQ